MDLCFETANKPTLITLVYLRFYFLIRLYFKCARNYRNLMFENIYESKEKKGRKVAKIWDRGSEK